MDITKLYHEKGHPRYCWRCYGHEFREHVRAYGDFYQIFEAEYLCTFCNESLAYWAYGGYDPYYVDSLIEYKETIMEKQRKEFDAANKLAYALESLNQVAVVDDGYPHVRHEFESALAAYIESMKENGRFGVGNRYGLQLVG